MISESFRQLRAKALAAVELEPAHHLNLGLREMIWSAFGPRATANDRLEEPHIQRIRLAVAGVVHVAPLWRQRAEEDEVTFEALTSIEKLLRGSLLLEDKKKVFDQLWEMAVHRSANASISEAAIGFASVQALSTAIYDEFYDPSCLDPERTDEDDPENHDSAYYSAVAQAGGLPGDENSSPERRLEFWRWWLNEGVESAFNATLV
jgi:hypothetical protein